MTRRDVLHTIATLLHSAIGLVVGVSAIRFLFFPLRVRREGSKTVRVAPLSSVPRVAPIRVPVISERRDAFLRYPPSAIGSVWLLRTEEIGGGGSVRCLQS